MKRDAPLHGAWREAAAPTLRDPGLGQRVVRPRYRLTVVRGEEQGKAFTFSKAQVFGGRAPTNDVVLSGKGVSGIHFEVALTEGGHLLRDAGSTNGTFLGGHRVREAYLAAGSVLRAGASEVRYDPAGGGDAVPLSARDRFGDLRGGSEAMRELFAILERLAPLDLTVLVEGETGTGKELCAQALHEHSPRGGGRFVVLDCAAIPPGLAESLLFGHERGAFTGADERRAGVFEQAHGGTLFVDEIGELPAELQQKFLRVLESREVARVGSHERFAVDVRVVAATHRDLRAMVNAGEFRGDLYFRVAQARVVIPPLRARIEDLPLLAGHFLAQACERFGRPAVTLAPDAIEALAARPWHGNARELRAVIDRAVALCEGPEITRRDLAAERRIAREGVALDIDLDQPFKDAKARVIERFEAEYLARVVQRHRGNLSRASRAMGLARNHLRRLLRLRGIPYQDL